MPSRAKKGPFRAAASPEPVCKWKSIHSGNHLDHSMKQKLLGALPTSPKIKPRPIAAALLFASAAIISSLPVWASPPAQSPAPAGNVAYCGGISPAQIPFPFADYYSCLNLGSAPGVVTPYGGLTFKYDDPNTILIGGGANDYSGRIYQIGVTR